MGNAQLDMFSAMAITPVQGVAIIAPPAPVREFVPTPPTLEWAKTLSRSEAGHETIVFVSHLWTGVVVEMLSDPRLGRLLLHKDGRICEIEPDPAARGRVIYMDARSVLDLHARRPLIPIGAGGTHAARYRFARPGEQAPELLPLPPKVDDCE